MRILGMVLAGAVALTPLVAAHAAAPGSKIGPPGAGQTPGVVQIRDGAGPGWRSAPNGSGRGWQQSPGHPRQWNGGSVRPHWGPNISPGAWGPYPRPGIPTYWVWGPSGGAFDYPFADWRGPTGGWGNP